MKRIMTALLCLSLCVPVMADAQGRGKKKGHSKNYVKMRPSAPRYTPVASPGDNYVYIRDDWRWDPTTSTWVWNGNRWVEVTGTSRIWVPGHWRQTRSGWIWQEGYWK